MGGTLVKLMIGAFFVGLASQLGGFAQDIVQRARESVQASELATLDGHLHAGWAMQKKRTRAPRDQAEFEKAVRDVLIARGGRDVTLDRWQQPYAYERLGDSPLRWRITSKGPDRRLGTKDDLVVERRDDRVELSRDPVEIAEQAEQRVRARDRDTLRELRELRLKLEQEKPAFEAGESAEDERRQLERSLEQLDRILEG